MTRMTHRALALALTAALLVPVATSAQAGDGWGPRGGERGWNSGWDRDHRHRPHNPDRWKKRDNTDAAIAAGVIGLAAGAILLGTLGNSNSAPPPPAYYPPAPAYGGPVYGGPAYGGPVYVGPAYGAGVQPIPQPGVPVDDRPIIAHGNAGVGYQPWSPAWYDYCRSRYRSFNPQTGTFTTYSGEKRFCQ
ncbi:BA14K family protein [Pannonibacter carbonis]|uniref:BA14K family protein n=1 Tax=Pannonibacter carbonis TaxID=2067569 RepID=UPI000D1002B0|nr:BA14K family protein [Pannonibacter carbonis]